MAECVALLVTMPMVASSIPDRGGHFSDGIFLALHPRRWEHMPWSHITLVVTEFDFKKNGGPRRNDRKVDAKGPASSREGEKGGALKASIGVPHGSRGDADKF